MLTTPGSAPNGSTLHRDSRELRESPTFEPRQQVLDLYTQTRARTDAVTVALSPEDQQLQSMCAASPTKWHRAHTTWFFETFVLGPAGVAPFDGRYAFLFNSYYETLGPRHARAERGLVSRPTAAEVSDYRRAVDERVRHLLETATQATLERVLPAVILGIAHEEQHQELVLTDILHAFSRNPLRPAYKTAAPSSPGAASELAFVRFEGGLKQIGAPKSSAFTFDNEEPRHKAWVEPFALADRLVSVRELKAFIREGGYSTPSLWLSEGFDFVRTHDVHAPLYSTFEDGELTVFGLGGPRVAHDDEPVVHVSYYEADAIAHFLGARLPTEVEWETAAADAPIEGNFVDDGVLRALPAKGAPAAPRVRQLFGDAWEWTRSSYEPYPGFAAPAGALGEYNGKFMVSQLVLRGGSCLTPRRHIRASYRNFWHPDTQFQMTGVRLARTVSP
jgi:ergothioneine biosynthesis protein EgtB